MHFCVFCSIFCNSQAELLDDKWVDKDDVEYYSAIKR